MGEPLHGVRATLIRSKEPALQGSCTHDWVESGRRGPAPHHSGSQSTEPIFSRSCPAFASKMHKKEKGNVAEGRSTLGLARFQLRRSISCLPLLRQTSLCPRQSVHPPWVPASTRALDEPDIWHGRTQCASAGRAWPDKAALCGRLPVPCHERCPPVPSPLGSTAQPEAAAPSGTGISPRQPRAGRFPMRQSSSAPAAQSSLVTNALRPSVLPSPPKHCSFLPTAAPLATLQLKECLSQELALAHTEEGGGTDQASPCATAAGSHPDPAAGRGHAVAPCCLGTAFPHAKQTSLVGLGWIHAEQVSPTQTYHQRDPAVHPQSFRDCPLALSPLTPLVGGTQSGEEGRGTGGAGCPQPGGPLCSRLRKRPPKPCSVHSSACTSHERAGAELRVPGWESHHSLTVSLLHSPAWQQGRTTFKGHRNEGVYHRPGPLLGRSRCAPGRSDGNGVTSPDCSGEAGTRLLTPAVEPAQRGDTLEKEEIYP